MTSARENHSASPASACTMMDGETETLLRSPQGVQEDGETETLLRLAQGVQEDMMVALLESVQSAAPACATICVQRLACLHKEMLRSMIDAEAQHRGGACDPSQTDMMRRNARLSILGQKMYSLVDTDSEDDNCNNKRSGACQKKEGHSIEDVYCRNDWEALPTSVEMAPTPVKHRQRGTNWEEMPTSAETAPTPVKHRQRGIDSALVTFKVTIDKQHWTPVVTKRQLIPRLQGLAQKHNLTWIHAVPSSGEIHAQGSHDSIETVKPELATILLELFPWADLSECLRVDGVRQAERVDPEDGQRYSLKALWERCGSDFSQDEVWAYWESQMLRKEQAQAEEEKKCNRDTGPKSTSGTG